MGEGDRRYGAAKLELKASAERVEQLCRYAFVLTELLHPGFLSQLNDASKVFQKAEHEAVRAAVEAETL